MESIFEFFFKFRLFFFESGTLTFQNPFPVWIWVVLFLGVPGSLFLLYRKRWISRDKRTGWILVGLRVAFFFLVALMLAEPSLVLNSLVPKENLLAIVVDNSRSMGIEEGALRQSRGEPVKALVREDSSFFKALDQKFYVRVYSFDSRAQRLEQAQELDWSGELTNIGSGLSSVLAETRSLPLGGVVLMTDGADTSSRNFSEVLSELGARKVPVHTVGVGPTGLAKDIEIVQISTPRVLLPETVAVARVTLRQKGYAGSRTRLEVREAGVLIQAQEVYLQPVGDVTHAEVTLFPTTEGLKAYEFKVQPLDGEEIVENNLKTTLVDVRDTRPRILYVEGHPRWEYKFIRQALREDNFLRLETLLRTALNKFYRQGIEEETILASGFPTDREDLFEYSGIILGSLESSFFTYGQMEFIRDFVSQRGGGFLMLGGSHSFQSGKYKNTPIEETLPVWLKGDDGREAARDYQQADIRLQLSSFGAAHPALQLALEADRNTSLWEELPVLKDWNRVDSLKPGTVTLATFDNLLSTSRSDDSNPLLAFQRFGRGQSIALLTGSTWRWQMLLERENQSHETFWRQMLRWLVNTAKDPVTVETEREIYSLNETVTIRAEVRDRGYRPINDARVEAVVTTPSGESSPISLLWDSREEGVYRANWETSEDGVHEVKVSAFDRSAAEETLHGIADAHFVSAGAAREYFNPVLKEDFLRNLSQETGGNYYTLEDIDKLPEEIVYTPSTASVVEVKELWDMPILFLMLLGLLTAEWVLRKRQGGI